MITDPVVAADAKARVLIPTSTARHGVAILVDGDDAVGNLHDQASRQVLVQRLAALLDRPFLGTIGRAQAEAAHILVVPPDTVSASPPGTSSLSRETLLGGAVPEVFIGTKAITHPVLDPTAARPGAWSEAMAVHLGDAALKGFTAFTVEDAARAGRALLKDGPVRLKDVCAKAGLGQVVVEDAAHLDRLLAQEDAVALAACGIVLEENLTNVVTYSVGVVTIGADSISYVGDQTLTCDNRGREVYGGSDLRVVRGELDALSRLDLSTELSRAIHCATAFDRAAQLAYPDAILTRRNYDVIAGTDARGERRIGVLEQSWRIGGASGAEMAAFEAFASDPELEAVRCATVERYGIVDVPAGATVYFQGHDPVVGAMTKYAMRVS